MNNHHRTAAIGTDSAAKLIVERHGLTISTRLATGTAGTGGWYGSVTKEELGFMVKTRDYAVRERIFQLYTDTFGADAPIIFHKDDVEIPLQYFPHSVRTAKTMLDITAGIVTIQKVFEDGQPLADSSFATPQYHIDIREGRIEPIANRGGWDFWEQVNRARAELRDSSSRRGAGMPSRYSDASSHIGGPLTMNAEDFNRLASTLPNAIDHGSLLLTVNGAPDEAEERSFMGELDIAASSENEEELHVFCRLIAGETAYALSSWPFIMLAEAERWRCSAALKTKKRFPVVVAAAFDLLHCHTAKERSALLNEVFSGPDYWKRKIASDAKYFAKSFAEGCAGRGGMLLADGSRWMRYSMDRRAQAQLLEIPIRMFGPSIFDGTMLPGEMYVSRPALMPRLSELQSKIEAAGFRLLFNGRSVRQVKWEITLDATRSTIDWFELRPEVKCEGGTVTSAEMAEALTAGGMYLKHGEYVMLDAETRSVLAILPQQKKSRGAQNEPVRIPRLQILDWLHLRKNGVTVRFSREDEKVFASLQSFDVMPATPVPEKIDATLRQYQIEGYLWLAFLYTHRFGACLADDMGLGKTLQAIALLAGLHEEKIVSHARSRLPHLIVVPPTLLFNWEGELSRFYPALRVLTYRGIDRTTDFSGADVVLTSYGVVQRDAVKLSALKFDVIIFDEAQAVKNIKNGTTGACRRLQGHFSLTLTGTPVENHLGEYYSVMDISVPGLLGDYAAFRRSMNSTDGSFLQTLIRRTRPFILRRSKTMIASELPPKVETDIYLELTARQKVLYTKTVEEVKATVDEAYRSRAAAQARIIALTAILRLRQLCLSPEILLPKTEEPSPKIEFLLAQLEELFDEGHSVLVFSQFTRFLDIVERKLADKRVRCLRLDGSTPVGERKKLVERFQQSETPSVFLLSLKAGGRGLNLTRATYVFHLDPWWNPAVEDQASDRAHRIGQTAQVTITRLIMRHTIEEKMMELKKRKLALYKALLDDAASKGGAGISKTDFDFLLA